MDRSFPETLAALRRAKNINQRSAAAALGISQALLSHYENGAREPGLAFVCRACDYYDVTADYLLGRTENDGSRAAAELRALAGELKALADSAAERLENL